MLDRLLDGWGITREGLVDLAMLVGTDFNEGIKGIGPKKALALVQRHGRIERHAGGDPRGARRSGHDRRVRRIFLQARRHR